MLNYAAVVFSVVRKKGSGGFGSKPCSILPQIYRTGDDGLNMRINEETVIKRNSSKKKRERKETERSFFSFASSPASVLNIKVGIYTSAVHREQHGGK